MFFKKYIYCFFFFIIVFDGSVCFSSDDGYVFEYRESKRVLYCDICLESFQVTFIYWVLKWVVYFLIFSWPMTGRERDTCFSENIVVGNGEKKTM